jgi:hypothetical protein
LLLHLRFQPGIHDAETLVIEFGGQPRAIDGGNGYGGGPTVPRTAGSPVDENEDDESDNDRDEKYLRLVSEPVEHWQVPRFVMFGDERGTISLPWESGKVLEGAVFT